MGSSPENLGVVRRLARIGQRPQLSGGKPFLDQVFEARLEERRLAALQVGDDSRVRVVRGDVVAAGGQTGGGYAAEMPEPCDADLHLELPSFMGRDRIRQARV
jgi:hypothetical protein